jgi:two-component system, cell cycle response regulator DivK
MTRVLLVDDNELNRDTLSRRLGRHGFEVTTAINGRRAIELAAALLPDLILMDVSMPGMSGFEATRRLKADPTTCGIPVIFLTAHARREDEEQAMASGGDNFATKPVELDRLLETMKTTLESTRG